MSGRLFKKLLCQLTCHPITFLEFSHRCGWAAWISAKESVSSWKRTIVNKQARAKRCRRSLAYRTFITFPFFGALVGPLSHRRWGNIGRLGISRKSARRDGQICGVTGESRSLKCGVGLVAGCSFGALWARRGVPEIWQCPELATRLTRDNPNKNLLELCAFDN